MITIAALHVLASHASENGIEKDFTGLPSTTTNPMIDVETPGSSPRDVMGDTNLSSLVTKPYLNRTWSLANRGGSRNPYLQSFLLSEKGMFLYRRSLIFHSHFSYVFWLTGLCYLQRLPRNRCLYSKVKCTSFNTLYFPKVRSQVKVGSTTVSLIELVRAFELTASLFTWVLLAFTPLYALSFNGCPSYLSS